MRRICLHDKATIETYFRRDSLLHVYSLGDLDDGFWPHTTWYALQEDGQAQAVALLYTGLTLPTLLAISQEPLAPIEELVASIKPLLPRRFWAHLSPGLADLLQGDYQVDSAGFHYKMGLTNPNQLAGEARDVVHLGQADLSEVQRFYDVAYPGNFFEPPMLETGHYYGLRRDGCLVCVAGVHVYSPRYRVAALGNIATRPECRGKGYAKAVVSHLCRQLLPTVDHIGLNVKTGNSAAVACYERLGFTVVGQYEEGMLQHA